MAAAEQRFHEIHRIFSDGRRAAAAGVREQKTARSADPDCQARIAASRPRTGLPATGGTDRAVRNLLRVHGLTVLTHHGGARGVKVSRAGSKNRKSGRIIRSASCARHPPGPPPPAAPRPDCPSPHAATRPPLAVLTGGSACLAEPGLSAAATTRRSPSSINEVNVRPSAAALRFARVNSGCGRRTVVRSGIGSDISPGRITIGLAKNTMPAHSQGDNSATPMTGQTCTRRSPKDVAVRQKAAN